MGIQQSLQALAKMFDYACGPGIASQASLQSSCQLKAAARNIELEVAQAMLLNSMVDKSNAGARVTGMSEI